MSHIFGFADRLKGHAISNISATSTKSTLRRWRSSTAPVGLSVTQPTPATAPGVAKVSCMTRLPTSSLLRTIAVSFFLTRPALCKPGMAIMRRVANSKSSILNPDTNPLLRVIIKPLIYDQFCAGTNQAEIERKVGDIKRLGFAGVILCYGKEIQLNDKNDVQGAQGVREVQIQHWLKGNLETLDMVCGGNWLGIKYTGAGQEVTEALLHGTEPPESFVAAMVQIAERAKSQHCRIWIDAEQQALQSTIDRWTIQFMRKFNTGKDVLIYNTIQAYLKRSREKLRNQLELAQKEGWNLAVKLVRGAYISNDTRKLIHDTKADTDASYNDIVHDLLSGKFEGISANTKLFLAGHNSTSIRTALALARGLAAKGELKVCPEFGQLQGMADEIGCEIIQVGETLQRQRDMTSNSTQQGEQLEPRAYKCLTWGTIHECMQYLVRRAVENSAAVDRMREGAREARRELLRRLSFRVRRQTT